MDPVPTHNIISIELAEKLGIKVGDMGPTLEGKGALKGQEVAVTLLIGKLRVHMQSFVEPKEFYVAPLQDHDVILGAPWFHRVYAHLQFLEKLVTFRHFGKEYFFKETTKSNTIPIVSNDSLKKLMKKYLFV